MEAGQIKGVASCMNDFLGHKKSRVKIVKFSFVENKICKEKISVNARL